MTIFEGKKKSVSILPHAILLVFGMLFLCAELKAQEGLVFDHVPDISSEEMASNLSSLDFNIPLVYNDKVGGFIDYFVVRNRDYTRMVMSRRNLYFPIFEKYLAEFGLPDELKYLAIVESGLNPKAISRAGAGGLWQFMPATGRMYQLHIDWYVDDRLDPEAATIAACKYLKSLYSQFGDWELALAAYNTGPGNVRKAIRRSGYKKTFWEIYPYLPKETRSYVPQFIAVIYAINFAEQHNLWVDEEHPMVMDTLIINQYLHIETLASQLNICPEDILKLNPQLKRGVVPETRKNYVLNIPYDAKPLFVGQRMALLDTASKVGKDALVQMAKQIPSGIADRERIVYRVKSGDVLGKIASDFRVNLSDLKSWNNLAGNTIYIGQRLNVWVLPSYVKTTSNTDIKTAVASAGQYHKVQPGDTLWGISKRYQNLSVEEIKKLNNLSGNNIKVGQLLLLGQN